MENLYTTFGPTKRHLPVPQTLRNKESGENIFKKSPQVMSSPEPHGMNRYQTNHAHQAKPERRPGDSTSQQAEGQPARAPDPATHTSEQATAAARHPPRQASEGPNKGQCAHVKQKPPLTRGNAVPEVGLELHSGPCNHWEVRKTKAIRASPTNVRPSPKRKSVDIVHTFFLLRFQLPRGHHRGFPLVTKHPLSAKGIPVGLHPPIALALAKAVERIPEVGALPGSLLYEPKWDGYIHCTLSIRGPSVRCRSG